MVKPPTSSKIIASSELASRLTTQLEQTRNVAVAFVDLCGSTQLKQRSQSEWLPIVCRFLDIVSASVTAHGGRTVKYIGDEVMAVFADDNGLAVTQAETFVISLDEQLSRMGDPYRAKYVFDYGSVADVVFPPADVLGTTVDRCARMSKIAQPGVAISSSEFVRQSRHSDSWCRVTTLQFKGLPAPVDIFFYKSLRTHFVAGDLDLVVLSLDELVRAVRDARALAAARDVELQNCIAALRKARERL
jgi:class 3 adenylate cyclase